MEMKVILCRPSPTNKVKEVIKKLKELKKVVKLPYKPRSKNNNIWKKIMALKPEDIKYLIIHHSASSRDTTTFEAIKRYHIEVRKWDDIGYHFIITGDGKVWNGRPEDSVGAHCKSPNPSMNFRSLGICLTGNFEVEEPKKEQIEALDGLLERLRAKYKIIRANVLGHGEVEGVSTLCPGKNLMPFIKTYRQRTENPTPGDNERSLALEEIISVLRKYKLI